MYISISKTLLKKLAKSQTKIFRPKFQNTCTFNSCFLPKVYSVHQKVLLHIQNAAFATLTKTFLPDARCFCRSKSHKVYKSLGFSRKNCSAEIFNWTPKHWQASQNFVTKISTYFVKLFSKKSNFLQEFLLDRQNGSCTNRQKNSPIFRKFFGQNPKCLHN